MQNSYKESASNTVVGLTVHEIPMNEISLQFFFQEKNVYINIFG